MLNKRYHILLTNQMAKRLVLLVCALAYFQFAQKAVADNDVEQVFKDNEIVPDVLKAAPKNWLRVITYKKLLCHTFAYANEHTYLCTYVYVNA